MTKRINRAIELLAQGQPVYYTGGHTGHVLTYEQGVADAGTWADARMFVRSASASKVTTPGCANVRHSSRLELTTGTGTAAACSSWYAARKPQLVVIRRAPRPAMRAAASRNGRRNDASACCTIRRGDAPRTRAKRTGMPWRANVSRQPMSPGGRGNRVSSISTATQSAVGDGIAALEHGLRCIRTIRDTTRHDTTKRNNP